MPNRYGIGVWEELLSIISDKAYPLESMQQHLVGYVNDATGWDLPAINSWFVERGYELVGYMDLFSENEKSGVFITVEGLVWRCNTNIADNQLGWHFKADTSEGVSLYDMRFLRGWAHQFIWDSDDKQCYIVNIAE